MTTTSALLGRTSPVVPNFVMKEAAAIPRVSQISARSARLWHGTDARDAARRSPGPKRRAEISLAEAYFPGPLRRRHAHHEGVTVRAQRLCGPGVASQHARRGLAPRPHGVGARHVA